MASGQPVVGTLDTRKRQPGYLVNKLDILSTKWTFCHPCLAKKSISDALAPDLRGPEWFMTQVLTLY